MNIGKFFVITALSLVSTLPLGAQETHRCICTKGLIKEIQVVTLPELTETILQEWGEGKYPAMAIEFPEGTRLPLQLVIRGDCLACHGGEEGVTEIEVLRNLYVRCFGGQLLLSEDLVRWEDPSRFFTGMISSALAIQDGTSLLSLQLEVNKR